MSVQLMSTVFMADFEDLPYQKEVTEGGKRIVKTLHAKASTVKLMLLAYADHANDEGEGSYPGYKRLERKTKLSRQGIADTLEAIKQNNFMTFEGWSKLDTHEYSLNKALLERLVKPLDSDEKDRVKPLDSVESSHLTPLSQATRTNPSSTPATSLTAEEIEQAGKLVELQVMFTRQALKYPNRDKFPEPLQPYSDFFVSLTGLKPGKKDVNDWLLSFTDWQDAGLCEADVRAAWEKSKADDGGFMVTRPGSLTKVAAALKAQGKTTPTPAPRVHRADLDAKQKELPDFVKQHAAARGIGVK